MSVFIDIERKKKCSTETCLRSAKEVAAFATQFKPGHWCSVEPASEKYVLEPQIPTNIKDVKMLSHCRWLAFSSVPLHTHYFQRQSHDRLDSRGKEEEITTSRAHLRTRRFSSGPSWQAIHSVFTIAFAYAMRLKIGTYKDEGPIDLDLKQLTLISKTTAETCPQLEATRC